MSICGGRGDAAEQMMPGADVLEFQLKGSNKLMIRPSGTEPKIKAYVFARGNDEAEADKTLKELDAAARALLS